MYLRHLESLYHTNSSMGGPGGESFLSSDLEVAEQLREL